MTEPEKNSGFEFTEDDRHHRFALESKRMDLDAGYLGRLFGSAKNSPQNIAGVVVVILVLAGVGALFLKQDAIATELWRIIAPILSVTLGYLFGKTT